MVRDWENENEIALRFLYINCCIVFVRYESRTVFGLVFFFCPWNSSQCPFHWNEIQRNGKIPIIVSPLTPCLVWCTLDGLWHIALVNIPFPSFLCTEAAAITIQQTNKKSGALKKSPWVPESQETEWGRNVKHEIYMTNSLNYSELQQS